MGRATIATLTTADLFAPATGMTMNCIECERLILAEGAPLPSPGQAKDLADHLAGCASCRRMQEELAAVLKVWQTDTARSPVPDPDTAWQELRPALRGSTVRTARRYAPLLWISAPLAAAAALALVIYQPAVTNRSDAGPAVRAEFVESGSPTASTMVYLDKESGWLVVWAADNGNTG